MQNLDEIYLRKMEVSDTDKIVEWRNKDRVRRNFVYQGLFTKEGHLNWIETQVKTGLVVQFIICEKDSGRAVGSVYFRDIDRSSGRAEYGIFIGEDDAVGKGYGTLAAKLALSYAFEELKLNYIFLRVFEDNMAARRSYEKAGFKLIEGKKEDIVIGGVVRRMTFMDICNNKNINRSENINDSKNVDSSGNIDNWNIGNRDIKSNESIYSNKA